MQTRYLEVHFKTFGELRDAYRSEALCFLVWTCLRKNQVIQRHPPVNVTVRSFPATEIACYHEKHYVRVVFQIRNALLANDPCDTWMAVELLHPSHIVRHKWLKTVNNSSRYVFHQLSSAIHLPLKIFFLKKLKNIAK
jgi:hypothetical protein